MIPRVLSTALTMLLLATRGSAGDLQTAGRAAPAAVLSMVAASPARPLPGEPVKCGLPGVSHALAARSSRDRSILLSTTLARPEMQYSITGHGFRVHFDSTGIQAAALLDAQGNRIEGTARIFADSVLSILSYVLSYETGALGYLAPPPDGLLGGSPEYDVYVMELGNLYGYTTPDVSGPDGSTSTSFITVDNDFVFVSPDSNKGLPGARVTLAHEFHHAIQIGRYGYWTSDAYFYEITSTWMEDVLFTGVNDYYNYLRASWSHFRNPDRPFDLSEIIMYSRAVWGLYVAKRFGADAMKACWEEVRTSRPLQAIDRGLQRYGSTFAAAFGEWTLWNYFTGARSDPSLYYPEGNAYPFVTTQPFAFPLTQSDRVIAGSLDNLSARYHEVVRGSDTLMLPLAHVDLAAAQRGVIPLSAYTFTVSTRKADETYKFAAGGLYVKTDVPDPLNWGSWSIFNGKQGGEIGPDLPGEGKSFPQPFMADGVRTVSIPLNVDRQVAASLDVFSTGMDRIARRTMNTRKIGTRECVLWDGRMDTGAFAPSGVYLFLIEIPGRTVTGKLALLRK